MGSFLLAALALFFVSCGIQVSILGWDLYGKVYGVGSIWCRLTQVLNSPKDVVYNSYGLYKLKIISGKSWLETCMAYRHSLNLILSDEEEKALQEISKFVGRE